MTHRLTPAERLAQTAKDATLNEIVARSEWDQHIVEQAVLLYGLEHPEWSCNELRDLLPEIGRGFLGAAINSLRSGGIIEHTDQMVPSTSPDTHAHRIAVWRLSAKGYTVAAARQDAVREVAA